MAFVVKDRVKQTSTTTGTTNMVLSGTSQGFQTFSSAISDGDTTTYAITDASGNFETGLGTWNNTTSTLARTTIYESSNSNNAVNFGAGTKDVFITLPASRSAVADQNGKTTFVDNIEVTGINVNKSTDPNITLRNTTAPSSTVVQLQGDASGTMWLLADGMNQANNSRIVMAVDGLEKFRINGGGSGNGAWGLGGQNYGTAGQCITSNGSTSAPTWQTPTVDLSSYSTTSTIASTYAPLSSPSLTGNPTAPTQTAGNSTTRLATTEFVTTAVSNLVDSAPGTLNTLNELASALGDDANFSTTVTNSIATKLPLSGGTMTGDLDMGSNDISTTGKVLFANMYATTSDLPSATNQHGMFAHVHATGKGYFAHGGNWIPLANESALASYLTTSSASSTYLTQSNASSTYMPLAGGTFSNDVTFTGANYNVVWDKSDNTLEFGDNAVLRIGTGNDLDIYHSSNENIIKTQTDLPIKMMDAGNSTISLFTPNGAVELYHNGSKKIETTSTGIQTTGTINVNNAFTLPSSDGSASQVLQTDGSGTVSWQTVSGGSSGMPTSGGTFTGAVTFNNSATVHVDSMFTFDGQNNYGIDFQLRGNNYDLVWYSAANTLKAWDNTRIRWGSGNDFDIYHDGSQTNFHIEQGTNPIVFSNNSNSELLKIESTGAVTVAGAFTLPTSDGATNQVLQTNGSGTVSWATVSGGGGGSMNDLIDDTTPQLGGTLDANSNQITNATTIGATKGVFTSGATGQLTLNSTSSDYMLEFQRSGTSEWWLKANSSNFIIHENGGSDYLSVKSGGNVGVGTNNPAQKLTVASEGRLRLQRADNTRYADIYNDNSFLNIVTSNDPIKLDGQSYIRFDVGGSEKLRIASSGQIGIGGTNYGSSGQVLTSNGSGSAPSWQTVSGGGGGGSGISVSDATALAFQLG